MSENIEATEKQNETTDEVLVYELGYHALSSLSEEQLGAEVSKLKEHIAQAGGTVLAEEAPTMFRLAYTIVRSVGGKREKYDTSYFGWIKFELPFGVVSSLEAELNKRDTILRFLIIKTVREDTRAGKRVLQAKEEKAPQSPVAAVATTSAPVVAAKSEEVSEEELNRTIDELVVE